jgi:hypothetical protein
VASSNVHLVFADGSIEVVESRFATDVRRRDAQIERRTAWKKSGAGAGFMNAGMLWSEDAAEVTVAASGVARGRKSGELLYALRTPAVGGLFAFDLASRQETRVFHGTGHEFQGLASSEIHSVLATAISQGKLRRSIAVMKDDGSEMAVVTEGDSFDDDPSWVPRPAVGDKCAYELVYSSAGIGRNQAGQFLGLGPRSVILLDAELGKMKTLIEDPAFDFVNPRMSKAGVLYVVRRPYVSPTEGPDAATAARDAALLPVRLGNALFNYLEYFTLRYSGKPLRSSGPTRDRAADARRMLELGNLAKGVARTERGLTEDAPETRVPTEWQLIAIEPEKEPRVVASRVAAFDIGTSGELVYTDGETLFALTDRRIGGPRKLATLPLVTELAAL